MDRDRILSTPAAELEPIDSPAALDWASQWTAATTATLKEDAEPLEAEFLEILDSEDRIPVVVRRGDFLYNFWRDREHPRGVWRRTRELPTTDEISWETLIDVDDLAREEEESWVWKGARVRSPEYDRALISLSRGGSDAVVIREFDLITGSFVAEQPFTLPEAKSDLSWVDRDHVLVGTDTGEESLTDSGYPVESRLWRRGQKISEAPVVIRGQKEDIAVGAWADPTPGFERIFARRALDFYTAEHYFLDLEEGRSQRIEVPIDAEILVHREFLFVMPRTDYAGIPGGGLGVTLLADFLAGDQRLAKVFSPTASHSLQSVRFSKNFVLLGTLNNVASSIEAIALSDLPLPGKEAEPSRTAIELPELVTASIAATAPLDGDEVFILTSSFLIPSTLLRVDLETSPTPEVVRTSPAHFDTSGMETRQHWVESEDGTRIPYFISGRFEETPQPTLVTAYGGFEVSRVPYYSALTGKSWLERGGLWVLANIRGGGEFGPQWHSQAVKHNRHLVFEDYQAVLEDLVRRGYTTTKQLGIRGGSNGGLLTSQAVTAYPETFHAAVVQVPLTDMLRYHRWLAGASWMAEYGDPDDPADREVLESYSPLHNVVDHQQRPYPATLVTTSTRDDRVHPAHARLFARRLAEAHQPVDYVENQEGGHAGAADNKQIAHMEALIFTWLWAQCAH